MRPMSLRSSLLSTIQACVSSFSIAFNRWERNVWVSLTLLCGRQGSYRVTSGSSRNVHKWTVHLPFEVYAGVNVGFRMCRVDKVWVISLRDPLPAVKRPHCQLHSPWRTVSWCEGSGTKMRVKAHKPLLSSRGPGIFAWTASVSRGAGQVSPEADL